MVPYTTLAKTQFSPTTIKKRDSPKYRLTNDMFLGACAVKTRTHVWYPYNEYAHLFTKAINILLVRAEIECLESSQEHIWPFDTHRVRHMLLYQTSVTHICQYGVMLMSKTRFTRVNRQKSNDSTIAWNQPKIVWINVVSKIHLFASGWLSTIFFGTPAEMLLCYLFSKNSGLHKRRSSA